MLVDEYLERSAAAHPQKVALIAGSRRATYGELRQRSNQLARALRRAGVARGDRVAVYLDNGLDAAVAIFGVLQAGGVFVVVNTTTKTEKLANVLNDCRAAAVVVDAARWPRLVEAADRLRHLEMALVGGDEEPDARDLPFPCRRMADACDAEPATAVPKTHIDVDLAALIYTSGSTGGPKGVMMTHRSITAAATSITTYLENTADDVILNVLPLSFGYGLYQLLTAVKVGGTVVLENHFNYPHRLLELAARERVSGLPVVPTMAAILLQMDLRKYALPSLRYLTNAGAALPVDHIRRLRALLPSVRIYSMYGLTECSRVCYLPPDQLDLRPASVGVPIPNTEAFIVNEAGEAAAPGETGELVVRGSHLMSGYWERPDDTARVLKPGPVPGEYVLHTGDLFRRDEEGYLYFVARRDDIIKTRGQKVSPREVEEVLLLLPGIAEAAVVGVADPVLSQAIKAVVTLEPGSRLTEQEIRRHCAERLEDFMVPRYVEVRQTMPKSAHGKIEKAALVGVGGASA